MQNEGRELRPNEATAVDHAADAARARLRIRLYVGLVGTPEI